MLQQHDCDRWLINFIHEGTTVPVEDEEAGFRRVKLANGRTG